MCGISLIISGVSIDSSSLLRESDSDLQSLSSPAPESKRVLEPILTVDNLKECLLRRGPDHLGSKKVFLHLKRTNIIRRKENVPLMNVGSVGNIETIAHRPLIPFLSNKLSLEAPLYDLAVPDFDKKDVAEHGVSSFCFSDSINDDSTSTFEVVSTIDVGATTTKSVAELHFLGATLQLRGVTPVQQPLVDTKGNILVYNGEIFGGIDVGRDNNDTESLMHELERCCSCDCHGLKISCYCVEEGHISVPELLSTIKGPWALIYWQARSKTIWFGRDAFGRRSLLVHWPTLDDERFLISSVSPISSAKMDSGSAIASDNFKLEDFEVPDETNTLDCWEELSCGIYSICLDVSKVKRCELQDLVGEVRKHEWTDSQLKKLIKWERTFIEPKSDEFHLNCEVLRDQDMVLSTCSNRKHVKVGVLEDHVQKQRKPLPDIPDSFMNGEIQCSASPAQKVLLALRESVMRRTTLNTVFQAKREEQLVPVALLFSGGLDSMILAALLDQCLDARYEIDLLNVSFDGQLAPDRISARAGVRELQRITCRRWRLVEIDADLSTLTSETKHVMSLIFPAKTYMDLNIGIALWLAAGGDGWVDDRINYHHQIDHQRLKYKSEAKILLVGSGADEQCAGYSRHKTKYRSGGWLALGEEMKLDMQRIWKRNLGRDDRCISDNGKEARFPFLDEDVIETLLDIPLWEIADLHRPSGKGDKKILREVARLLGLEEAANLPKRAIQFGSRIARESNRKNFGSNRAANQASAGSVVIRKPHS